MDRITNIAWKTTSGATLGGFGYEYDAVGRIESRRHEIGDPSHPSQMSQSSQKSYTYDALDRLASDGGVTYTYDAAGNRMTKTENGETTTYMLGIGDRLASWTGGAYSYNAAGCVTRIECDGKPTLDMTWDSQYQLMSVSTNGVFAEGYEYDAIGRRVSTTTAEGRTRHVYDSNWQVIADIDEQGNVVASYIWGAGIDNLLAVKIGGSTYYPLTDMQGTVWGYVDSQNSVVARWQYDAWGNVVDEEVTVPALATLRYRFQGREWSAATGLINFRMRWYDPETGRWLSKDPIGLRGGLNLYAFCGNDSVDCIDGFGCSRIVIKDVNGGVTTMHNPSLHDFRDEIEKRTSGSINEVIIYDHGSRTTMGIDGDGNGLSMGAFDNSGKGRVQFDNGGFVSDLFGDRIAPGGSILLSGCNTAREWPWNTENIAKALSREMPGVKITGNIGAAIGNSIGFFVPLFEIGPTVNRGIRRSYIDGNECE